MALSRLRLSPTDGNAKARPARLTKLRNSSQKNIARALTNVCTGGLSSTPKGFAPAAIDRTLSRSSVRSITSLSAWNRLSIIASSEEDEDVSTTKRYSLHIPDSPPETRSSSDLTDPSFVTASGCDTAFPASSANEAGELLPELKRFAIPGHTPMSGETFGEFLERVFQFGACEMVNDRLSATEVGCPRLTFSNERPLSDVSTSGSDVSFGSETPSIGEAEVVSSGKPSIVSVYPRSEPSDSGSATYPGRTVYQAYSGQSLSTSSSTSFDTAHESMSSHGSGNINIDNELNLPPPVSIPPVETSTTDGAQAETSWFESSSDEEGEGPTLMTETIETVSKRTKTTVPAAAETIDNGLITRAVTNARKSTPSRYVMVDSYPKWIAKTRTSRIRPRSIRSKSAPAHISTRAQSEPPADRTKYTEDVRNGVMSRVLSNAKETPSRRPSQKKKTSSRCRLSARMSGLETVSEKPELMLEANEKNANEVVRTKSRCGKSVRGNAAQKRVPAKITKARKVRGVAVNETALAALEGRAGCRMA